MIEKAIAAAVMVNLTTGDHQLVDLVTDDGKGLDPQARIENLWESVKEDWPGYQIAFVLNEAARELMAHRRLWLLGMREEDNTMTERIKEHNDKIKSKENNS